MREEHIGENLESLVRFLRIREHNATLVIVDFEMPVRQHLNGVLAAIFLGRLSPRFRQIAITRRTNIDLDILRHLPLVLALEQLGHPEWHVSLVLLPVGHRYFGSLRRWWALISGIFQELIELAAISRLRPSARHSAAC